MLNLDMPPRLTSSSFRSFLPQEKHVTRVCPEDVLLLVYEGVLRFHEDGAAVEVPAGTYYIQRRGLRQEGRVPSDMPKYYYIHLIGDYAASAHMLPMTGKADFTQLMPLCRQMDVLRLSQASRTEQQAVLYQILSVLSRQFAATEAQRTVQKVVTRVFGNLQEDVSLDDMASWCGYSKNYIIRLFRQETGLTPHAYITRMKLDMARRLLTSSEMSISQVGQTCGFKAYTNFYKEFLRAEGCPPTQWRRRCAEGEISPESY